MEKKDDRGAKIRLERIRREWIQKYLADLAGCSESLVGKIEKGERENSRYIVVLEKILDL